jgi:SAM-dependent methyltransferase
MTAEDKRFGPVRRFFGRALFVLQQATDLSSEPHFVRDYRRLVRRLKADYPIDTAMSLAVGGGYSETGERLADAVQWAGLSTGHSLLDLGCGSGRLSSALSKRVEISYCGIDIIPELLAYARRKAPESYEFVHSKTLSLPVGDAQFDFAASFSVFTHLRHEETFTYFGEISRVLKPGGKLVFSFLEFAEPTHWKHFQQSVDGLRLAKKGQLNAFIERSVLQTWAERAGFSSLQFEDTAGAASYSAILGQTVAILTR